MGITSPFFFLCVIHLVIFLKSASSIHLGSPNRITKEVDQEQFNSTDEEYYYNVAKLLAELSQRNHIVRKQEITHDSDSVQRTPLVSEELVLDYNHDESEGSSSWNSTMFAQMLVTQEDEDEVIRAKCSMVLYSPGRSMFCVPVLARTEQRVTPVDRGYHWDIRSFDRRRYRRSISSEGVNSLESMQTEDEEQVRVERGLPFYEPPPEHENGYVRPQYPQEICEGINMGYEKRKIRCPPDTKCGLRIRDAKSCSSVSTECALDPICLPSHVRCNCRNTHICAFKEVGCNEHGCDSVPVCLLIAIGNQVTQENDVEYAGTTKCKIMGSPKTDICQPGESCSAVLPHGATCEGASELSKHCPLEPRCLRKKDYRKCENPSCRLLKKTCVLAEDCDEDELDFRKRCIFTPRCLDFVSADHLIQAKRKKVEMKDPYLFPPRNLPSGGKREGGALFGE
ncbi:unnamed protein product [Notodromas monacha]|uniref:Uncharacterized protein n=1 Tax=Notodromas monacha TaxID=399045 RepID=A0A7R9BNJ9_9CRUS|nr:unnamed protein product [Notodromas monacha]CAG0917964.1 unnamed protein product [Notodromas monacha]